MSSLGVDLIELLAEIENATLSPEQALDRIFARLAAEIQDIEARAEAATPGPWVIETDGEHGTWIKRTGTDECVALSCGQTDERVTANADFIVHARADLLTLLTALRAARAIVVLHALPAAEKRNAVTKT
jgi:hypothetical protein